MRIKLTLVLILISAWSFPWGEEGHKLIAGKAIDLLKEKIKNIEQYKEYVTQHSIDADLRKDYDKSEGHKHFIDIDFYDEYLSGKMITDKIELSNVYGDSIVAQMGILPWATLETLQNLTKAFTEKNRDKILILMSDLAHYVADAHQPMHTMLNYNGQLTDQKGIHQRYESVMLEKHLDEISMETNGYEVKYVDRPLDYIFTYISSSNSVSDVLFSSDKFASSRSGSTNSEEYYRLLWLRTEYITKVQFEAAYNCLASLIYTSWVDAGEPAIKGIK